MILRLNSPFFLFGCPMSDIGSSSGFKPLGQKFMRPPEAKPEEKLRQVSDMYEKHFLREMMKAMRSTVHESGFIQQNQAEKIFREQLDDQYVDKWGEKGGIGLSDMIFTQLVEKFGVQMGIKSAVTKPQGPLPLTEKDNFAAQPFQHPGKKDAVSYRLDKKLTEASEVKVPWDGVLLGKKNLADDQTLVDIGHDNGLRSQLVFKGGLSNVSTGQKLQAGDTLGFLSSEAKSLYWTVEPGPESVSE